MEILTYLMSGVLGPLLLGGAAYVLSTTPAEGCSATPGDGHEAAEATTPSVIRRAHCTAHASACEPD